MKTKEELKAPAWEAYEKRIQEIEKMNSKRRRLRSDEK